MTTSTGGKLLLVITLCITLMVVCVALVIGFACYMLCSPPVTTTEIAQEGIKDNHLESAAAIAAFYKTNRQQTKSIQAPKLKLTSKKTMASKLKQTTSGKTIKAKGSISSFKVLKTKTKSSTKTLGKHKRTKV